MADPCNHAAALQVPLTVAAFALLPMPLLGPSPPLTARFLIGVVVLLMGLAVWNLPGLASMRTAPAAGQGGGSDTESSSTSTRGSGIDKKSL